MEEKLLGRIIEGLNVVHAAYVKTYTKYGLDATKNSKGLMEKIFQETYQISMQEMTKRG